MQIVVRVINRRFKINLKTLRVRHRFYGEISDEHSETYTAENDNYENLVRNLYEEEFIHVWRRITEKEHIQSVSHSILKEGDTETHHLLFNICIDIKDMPDSQSGKKYSPIVEDLKKGKK